MKWLESWSAILDAVRDPFSLAGLAVLVVMVVLRLSLSKVVALKGTAAYRTVMYSITVAGVLALAVTLGAITLRFYEIQVAAKRESLLLTRVEAETFLQSSRGNIERCLSRLPERYFYIDFVFTSGDDNAVNMDIIPGDKADPGLEFMHPRLRQKEVEGYSAHEALRLLSTAAKLSVVAPDVNGCIVGSLRNDLRRYALQGWATGFVHRYITDDGGGGGRR